MNPPFPQQGQPAGPVPWGVPGPPAPRRPRANAAAAVIAGALAVLTAVMLVWFALDNVVHATGAASGLVVQNALGGIVGAALLLVAAGFTFARRIPAAWALFVLCVLYVLATFVAPVLRGTTLNDQLQFLFGFRESDDIAIGLAIIFAVLTAATAAVAGGLRESPARP